MKIAVFKKIVVSFTLLLMLAATQAVAASSPLLQARKDAETKGYIFLTSHDEIVAMAKKEGKLKVFSGLQPANFKPWIDAFKQKYPFITDISVEEVTGTDSTQRLLLEVKADAAGGYDITRINTDFAQEYIPYLMKHDILGMAKQGVLKINPGMIHPVEKNFLSITSTIQVTPYNKKLISADRVPAKWEDFLKPEFKGRKFAVDIRPIQVAGLVPAWGLDRTVDFARKLAAQQPVWGRSNTRINASLVMGEYPLFFSSVYNTLRKVMDKDPTGSLGYKIIEPIPTRVADDVIAILKTAPHPHAALLWMEFLTSPEAQEIIDKYEPFRASIFHTGSVTEQMTRGKKLSVIDWSNYTKMQEYMGEIFEAFGFPKADK
jgi:iron(III) transport system substrate-binding protein